MKNIDWKKVILFVIGLIIVLFFGITLSIDKCYICHSYNAPYNYGGEKLCNECYKRIQNKNWESTNIETEDSQDKITGPSIGQQNALQQAISYLNVMPFSEQGLFEQLEYEGYSYLECLYAINNCNADWYQQAKLTAESYLNNSAFSRNGLIDQLLFEGFTYDEAVFGVNAMGY